MAGRQSSSSSGIGIFSLLGLVFITLKLCGVIDWSWWWVTSPFWGPAALFVGVMLCAGVGLLLILIVGAAIDRWQSKKK